MNLGFMHDMETPKMGKSRPAIWLSLLLVGVSPSLVAAQDMSFDLDEAETAQPAGEP
jgi:hypothetical protein